MRRSTKKKITEEMKKAIEGDFEKIKESEARIAGIREFHKMW